MTNRCKLCALSSYSRNNIKGYGNVNAPLVIYHGTPLQGEEEQLLLWMLLSMSLTEKDVYVDWILRCPEPRVKKNSPISKKKDRLHCMKVCTTYHPCVHLLSQQIVAIGNIAFEAFSDHSEVGKFQGRYHEEYGVWATYSLAYALMSAAESLDIFRVLWRAAEVAGLRPIRNKSIRPFEFPDKKKL